MPAGWGQDRAHTEDAGTRNFALGDRRAQGVDHLRFARADIAHRGEAGSQGEPSAMRRVQTYLRVGVLDEPQPVVPVELRGQMHMAVDQPR